MSLNCSKEWVREEEQKMRREMCINNDVYLLLQDWHTLYTETVRLEKSNADLLRRAKEAVQLIRGELNLHSERNPRTDFNAGLNRGLDILRHRLPEAFEEEK